MEDATNHPRKGADTQEPQATDGARKVCRRGAVEVSKGDPKRKVRESASIVGLNSDRMGVANALGDDPPPLSHPLTPLCGLGVGARPGFPHATTKHTDKPLVNIAVCLLGRFIPPAHGPRLLIGPSPHHYIVRRAPRRRPTRPSARTAPTSRWSPRRPPAPGMPGTAPSGVHPPPSSGPSGFV